MLYSLLESRLRSRAAGLAQYRSLVNDQIVASYQAQANALDSAWLQSLSGDCLQAVTQQRRTEKKVQNNQQFHSKVLDVVDRIMEKLHSFAMEFNLAVGWNLHISATPPSFVTEAVRYNSAREAVESNTTYRARLATRLWSLVVRAQRNQIEFFLLPTQCVMGLSKSEHVYPAVLTLAFENEGWFLNDKPCDLSNGADALCRVLFKMLVNKCMQETGHRTTDPFLLMCNKRLDKPSEQTPPPESTPVARACDDTPTDPFAHFPPADPKKISIGEFLKRMQNQIADAEQSWNLPSGKDRDPNVTQQVEPIMTRYDAYNDVLLSFTFLIERVERQVTDVTEDGAQAFRRRDLSGVKRACLDLIAAQANEKRVLEMRHEWLNMRAVGEALSQHDSEATTPLRGHSRDGSSLGDDVYSSLDFLIDAVDVVVEAMAECGSDAFALRDFAQVDLFRQHALTVMEFKRRAVLMRDEWSRPQPAPRAPQAVPITSTASVSAAITISKAAV